MTCALSRVNKKECVRPSKDTGSGGDSGGDGGGGDVGGGCSVIMVSP